MKNIQPKKIWRKGNEEIASILHIEANDNCKDGASVSYRITNEDGFTLENDRLHLSGEFYDNWDSNDYLYNWVADVLGLELISE